MRTKSGTVEETLARLATDQWGCVTRAQLLEAGVSASGIRRRVEKGLLISEYRGVYRVGHRAPSDDVTSISATS